MQLAALILTIVAALGMQIDMKHYISHYYPVEASIKELLHHRVALPVGGGSAGGAGFQVLNIPKVVQELIRGDEFTAVSHNYSYIISMLSRITANIFTFAMMLGLWWGVFHFFSWLVRGRQSRNNLTLKERWAGCLTGTFRYGIMLVMLAGLLTPLTWLLDLPHGVFNPEDSFLVNWAARLFFIHERWLH